MSAYSVVMEIVQRERRTKERIDGMDTQDLVEEIHTLEDKIEELERDSHEAGLVAEHYRVHIARLKAAFELVLEKLDNSEAGEFAQDEIAAGRAALAVEC